MNLIEAVTALKNGECEEIESPIGARYHLTPEGMIVTAMGNGINLHFTHALGDWTLVNPIPKTEDVEVKRWECLRCGRVFSSQPLKCSSHITPGEYTNACAVIGDAIVELTGHYSRPIPRKVKKRVEITLRERDRADTFYRHGIEFNGPVKFFAEWEETDG